MAFLRRCGPLYETIKQSELFAIQPAPRFERRARYGTTFGVLVSIVVLGIGIAYAAFSINRLVFSQKASIVRQIAKGSPSFHMDPFALTLPRINDPAFFTVAVEFRVQAPGKRANRTTLNLVAESLDTLSYGYRGFTKNLTEQFLDGDCRLGECAYIRVKVYPCQNGTSAVPCATASAIDDIVNGNYLLLNIRGQDSTDGTDVDRSFELSLKDGLSFRQRFLFDVMQHTDRPNYLTTWVKFRITTLQTDSPLFSIDRLPRLKTGPDTEYCKIDFSLSGYKITQEKHFTTSLDCIGEIAAFFGAIAGVAAIVMTAYNEKAFYGKYPAWTNFDGKFKPMPEVVDDAEMEEAPESTPPRPSASTAKPGQNGSDCVGNEGKKRSKEVGKKAPVSSSYVATETPSPSTPQQGFDGVATSNGDADQQRFAEEEEGYQL